MDESVEYEVVVGMNEFASDVNEENGAASFIKPFLGEDSNFNLWSLTCPEVVIVSGESGDEDGEDDGESDLKEDEDEL